MMTEEISLDDIEPMSFSIESEPHSTPTITNGVSDQRQSLMTKIFKQRKNTSPKESLYLRLQEDESESDDTIRQQISSNKNVLPRKNKICRCLCYILLTTVLITLILLSGFALGQVFPLKSSSIESKYTVIWTNDSSNVNIFNSSISVYYYTVFEIRVVVTSNYTFFSESNITTSGYIYNNTFNLDNPSLNLLKENGNNVSNETEQFKITVSLQPWTSYMLVVKTFSPKPTGKFVIIASGPTKIALRQILTPPLHETVYSSEWTIHSQVYCRDRCSTPDYDYNFDDNYYYETILINVSRADDFTIMSQSNINTYGYLYKNNFHPSDTSLNLITEDDNSGNNEQFKLTSFLQPSTIYVLVVTTFSPHVMGKFSILASGTSLITLTRVSFDSTTTETTTSLMVQSNYYGRLNKNSSLHCDGDCHSSSIYYEVIEISVGQAGSYSFRSQSDFDLYGAMYVNSFDPSNPSMNLLDHNDRDGEDLQLNRMFVLQPQTTYVLVVAANSVHEMGSFQIIASGPMSVNFIRATTTREIQTTSPSAQSTYSSMWTTESQSYCRTSCTVSYYYYYEAIQVHVSSHGTFSLVSKSSVDAYGYLYSNRFDPLSPSSNLLLQDNEGGNNGQFKLTFSFKPDSIYILVVTTFNPNVTGSFSISASGLGIVTLSAYVATETL